MKNILLILTEDECDTLETILDAYSYCYPTIAR